jgi:BMFP domain-containing protein YqiC
MIDFRFIDELTRRLSAAMPPGLSQARDDLESHFRAILTGAFERMDLVTRDQFEAQSQVLERSREKLEALEKKLADLEAASTKSE